MQAELIQAELDSLVRERQRLRVDGADDEALERNRREIVRHQWALAQALLSRHLSASAAPA